MSQLSIVTFHDRTYGTNYDATCTTRCLVYLAPECSFCKKQVVGNTTQLLRDRITGRRNNTESALKCHLVSHNTIFNMTFKFMVICKPSPEKLNELETI